MKSFPLVLLLLAISVPSFAQNKNAKHGCKMYLDNKSNPNEQVKTPCACPKKIEDCECYVQSHTGYAFNDDRLYDVGEFCIGNKHMAIMNEFWDIDEHNTNIDGSDTLHTYSISRKISSYWKIPKEEVAKFTPQRWQFASQVYVPDIKKDTIINYRDTIYHKVYVKFSPNGIIADTTISTKGLKYRMSLANAGDYNVKFPTVVQKAKCLFITGYRYNDYIYIDGKETEVQKLVKDWTTGTLSY